MPRSVKIAYRNRNRTGWWIFSEVTYWVSNRQKKLTPKSRCLVWENLRLIKAKSREAAYAKALKLGKTAYPCDTGKGEWRFAGISMLLPVYEKIEDGSEILWEERELTLKRIKQLAKSKQQLSVFDDKEEA